MKRAVALALLFSLLLSGCAGTKAPEKKQYTATFLTLFDTVTSIVGRAENQEELMEKADMIIIDAGQYCEKQWVLSVSEE